jgi:hypothetical protein
MRGQDGVNVVLIGAMIILVVAIFLASITNTIGKKMLFKIGERSENCVFNINYNRSVNWVWSVDSTLGIMNIPFSCSFEWDDWFCIYSSYEHWSART